MIYCIKSVCAPVTKTKMFNVYKSRRFVEIFGSATHSLIDGTKEYLSSETLQISCRNTIYYNKNKNYLKFEAFCSRYL